VALDLEDRKLARIAQRRYGLQPDVIARATEALESSPGSDIVQALEDSCAITPEEARSLADLRARGRPGGMKLVSVLGKGASATVYKARDEEGCSLAVKVLNGSTPRDYRRREHEVRALDRLRHEAIPRLVATGEIGGRPYHVMEAFEGETLAELASRKRRLPWRLVAEVGFALAGALEHVHEQGVIHRDVKPSNVVLTAGGARLVDFGLACLDGTSGCGAPVGTPGYVSPEIARGEQPSEASDVYSFGATLYYALTGEYPLDGETPDDMIALAADRDRPVTPLLVHREDLPARLIALVEGCLEKDAALRPTFAEATAALERLRASASSRPLRRRARRARAA
jgi:serine/threonine-protein kinase